MAETDFHEEKKLAMWAAKNETSRLLGKERKFKMRNLQALYSAVMQRTASGSTAVDLDDEPIFALELPDVVVDLHQVLGSKGLLPFVKELQDELISLGISPSNTGFASFESFTSFFILGIPTPRLDDCSLGGNEVLVKNSSRRILQLAVCSKYFYNSRQP